MNRGTWLADVPWELVIWQNQQLCQAKNAHHDPTSDGYVDCKTMWEEGHRNEMSIDEMVDFRRRCHRLAPFTNFNGNTFAAIARILVKRGGFPAEDETLARSLAGHIVAGVAGEEEITAFRKLCASLG